MKNLKVAKKLFISYALIFVLLIAGYIVSIADLMGMGRQIETCLLYTSVGRRDGEIRVNGFIGGHDREIRVNGFIGGHDGKIRINVVVCRRHGKTGVDLLFRYLGSGQR